MSEQLIDLPTNGMVYSAELPDQSLENQNTLEIREIPGTDNFYNAAAWVDDSKVHLLGRQLLKGGGDVGEPDVGALVMLTLGKYGVESTVEIWQPNAEMHLLEDPRVLSLADGTLIFGLTSVAKVGTDYVPHPAILVTTTEQLKAGLPQPRIITKHGPGDQTTPIGENLAFETGKNATAIDETSVIFRPEGPEYNHSLRVFSHKDGVTVRQQDDIQISGDIEWAQYRIGTTIPPIWLNASEAVFPLHGITIDQNNKYVYSIGAARMTRDAEGRLLIDCVGQQPLIHPDQFVDIFEADSFELHNERRVVYCCGGIPIYNELGEFEKLKLYINVGDKRTVEVTVPAEQLMQNWPNQDEVQAHISPAA